MEDVFLDMSELSFEMSKLGDDISRTIDMIDVISNCTGESFESNVVSAMYAGLPVEANDINISMENKDGIIKSLLKSLYNMIVTFFKKGWEFLSNLDPVAKFYDVRMKNLKNKAKIYSRKKLRDGSSVSLGRNTRYVKAGRTFYEGGVKLSSEITRRKELLDYITNGYFKTFKASAEKSANIIAASTSAMDGQAIYNELTKSNGLKSIVSELSMTLDANYRFGAETLITKPYIGDKSMYFVDRKIDPTTLSGLVFYGPKFESASSLRDNLGADRRLAPIRPGDIIAIIDSTDKLFNSIVGLTDGSLKRQLSSVENTLLSTVSKLSNKDLSQTDIQTSKRVLQYQLGWMRSIFFPLVIDSTYLFRTMSKYINDSTASYE